MGNCTSAVVDTENTCYICKKKLSKRYLKCQVCNHNFHHSCAFLMNKNLQKCCVCMSENSYFDKIDFNSELVSRRQTV